MATRKGGNFQRGDGSRQSCTPWSRGGTVHGGGKGRGKGRRPVYHTFAGTHEDDDGNSSSGHDSYETQEDDDYGGDDYGGD